MHKSFERFDLCGLYITRKFGKKFTGERGTVIQTAVAYDNQITTWTRGNVNEMYLTYVIASMSRLDYLMSQTFY